MARCSKQIYGGMKAFGGSVCSRKAIVTEDGQGWCKQHAPSTVKARRAERDKKWQQEHQVSNEQYERRAKLADIERRMVQACWDYAVSDTIGPPGRAILGLVAEHRAAGGVRPE